jgi:hypothetical protein
MITKTLNVLMDRVVFPSNSSVLLQLQRFYVFDAVQIWRVEEIGVRFGGIPYIRFRA